MFRVHAQGKQNCWHETNGWSVVLNLLQIPTQNIAIMMYFITDNHLSNSKRSKDACLVSFIPICETGKKIPLATIWHKS